MENIELKFVKNFKTDFEDIYPEMAKKIEECTFCSIDCELSGVTQYKDLNSFDTPKNRYDKLKKVLNKTFARLFSNDFLLSFQFRTSKTI